MSHGEAAVPVGPPWPEDYEPSVGDELAARSVDLLGAVRALAFDPPEGASDAEILAGLRVLLGPTSSRQ